MDELYTELIKGYLSDPDNIKLILDSFEKEYIYFNDTYIYKIYTEALRMYAALKLIDSSVDYSIVDYTYRINTCVGETIWRSIVPVGFKSKSELVIYWPYNGSIELVDVSEIEGLFCKYDFGYFEKYSLKMGMLGKKNVVTSINGESYAIGIKADYMLDIDLLSKRDFAGVKGIQGYCGIDKVRDGNVVLNDKLKIASLHLQDSRVKISNCEYVYITEAENSNIEISKAKFVKLFSVAECTVVLKSSVRRCLITLMNIYASGVTNEVKIYVECLLEDILFDWEFYNAAGYKYKFRLVITDKYAISTKDSILRLVYLQKVYGDSFIEMPRSLWDYFYERKKELDEGKGIK